MFACDPFVPAVTVPQLKLVSVLASVSVTRVPGVSAYTITVAPEATATTRSRAVLLRFRLIAAARFVAFVATVLFTSKSSPVFVVADEVRVRVTAVPLLGVIVMAVVLPAAGSALKVPVTLARVFPVDALTGNTTKSAVQLGVAVTSKEYLAGNMPSATPPAPSETAQSLAMPSLKRLLHGRRQWRRSRPEPGGSFPCRSHSA